jgi:ammonium transporter, Amt family
MSKSQKGWAAILAVFSILSAYSLSPQAMPPVGADSALNQGDIAWMMACSGLVLLMTPGLGFFYGGMVNTKNLISTIFQSFAAMGVVSLVWFVCGFSLSFGPSIGGFIGNPTTYFMLNGVGRSPNPDMGATIPFVLYALFQMKFAIITPALISGAFAERIRFSAYLLFIALWSLCVYSPLAHWTWGLNGIFREWGVLDFAGGTVVHISAGMAAIAGALFIGPRLSHQRGEEDVPSNIPFVIMGTGLLWFGWFGFNAGSSLGANDTGVLAFLNTNTSSSVAMLTWLAMDGLRGKKPSAVGACIGAVVGLVAITPAAGYVSVSASLAIGFFTAVVSNQVVAMKRHLPFDDALDVFACHGIGGIMGMLLTAVFALEGGLITGQSKLFLIHIGALLIAAVFSFVASYALFFIVNTIIPLRVTKAEEEEGLDRSQHGEVALGFSYGMSLIGEISDHLRDLDGSGKEITKIIEEDSVSEQPAMQ